MGDALILGVDDAGVGDDVSGIELDLDRVWGFAHFDPAADPGHGSGVAVGVESDVAFNVDRARVEPVNGGDPGRQRDQMRSFDGEQFPGNGADMFLVSSVDAVAPLAGLEVQILPT